MASLQSFLRPTLRLRRPRPCNAAAAASYLRFYSIAQDFASDNSHSKAETSVKGSSIPIPNAIRAGSIAKSTPSQRDQRAEALRGLGQDLYPRLVQDATAETLSTRKFSDLFSSLNNDETPDIPQYSLNGMLAKWIDGSTSSHSQEESGLCGCPAPASPSST
ncbi:MAG: hypothetical protein Q9168_004396 [Polycauliona sp. 1 TL-2023]